MDKDVKDLLDWLEDKNGDIANLWGMEDLVSDPNTTKDSETKISDAETLAKIFNPEQLRFVKILLKNVVEALAFHNKEDDSTHPDMREELKKMDAKLRNHRHELSTSYSAKAEF
jgi:hypothetical protein